MCGRGVDARVGVADSGHGKGTGVCTCGAPSARSAPKVPTTPATSTLLTRSTVLLEAKRREPPPRPAKRGAPAASGRVPSGRNSTSSAPPCSM
eukprot:scaffold19092_cov90-Isochrysis_galbana.AAC.2